MRGTNVFPGRPDYYDRTPSVVTLYYSATNIAPHSTTVRASRTVPTGKKGWLETVYLQILRRVAATTVQTWRAAARYTPSGGAVSIIIEVTSRENTVARVERESLGYAGYIGAGDLIELITSDLSTGGGVDYDLAAKLTEFDA